MIKRVFNFDRHDWRHLYQLLGVGIKELFQGNTEEAIEAFYWIRFHLSYDSTKVK